MRAASVHRYCFAEKGYADAQLRFNFVAPDGMRMGNLLAFILIAILASTLGGAISRAQTVNLCIGEHWDSAGPPGQRNLCAGQEAWIPCGTNVAAWATKFCKASGASGVHTRVKLRDIPGNHCGYANIRITCQ